LLLVELDRLPFFAFQLPLPPPILDHAFATLFDRLLGG